MMAHSDPWRGRIVWGGSLLVHAWFFTIIIVALNTTGQEVNSDPILDTVVQEVEIRLPNNEPVIDKVIAPITRPRPNTPLTKVSVPMSIAPGNGSPIAPGNGSPIMAKREAPVIHKQLHRPAAPGQSVVYVLDRSSSMGEQGRFELARDYLIETLRNTAHGVRVQVVIYNRTAEILPLGGALELVQLTPERCREAESILTSLNPEGKSAHIAGLRQALLLAPDAIFLLTDADDITDADVKLVGEANGGRSSIHAVRFASPGSGWTQNSTLLKLARENRGSTQIIAVQPMP